MGRRRPGALFDEEPEQNTVAPAPDSSVTETPNLSDKSGLSDTSPAIAANVEERPKRERTPEQIAAAKARRAARESSGVEETLRDVARRQAGKNLKARLKFFTEVADGKKTPTKFQYDANAMLMEIALDKTPTAQPVVTQRKRILIGQVGGTIPGRRAGGDPVTKIESPAPSLIPPSSPETNG